MVLYKGHNSPLQRLQLFSIEATITDLLDDEIKTYLVELPVVQDFEKTRLGLKAAADDAVSSRRNFRNSFRLRRSTSQRSLAFCAMS